VQCEPEVAIASVVDQGRPLDYLLFVEFEWNPLKSDQCYAERGFDFEYATRAFLDPGRSVFLDSRWDYGEERYVLRGSIDARLFVVVFTYRGDAVRIISARKANSREVKDHEKDTLAR
jgi:uncharacterized protein